MTTAWARTIRFRLAATYSSVLFGLTALVVTGLYLVLSSVLEAGPLESSPKMAKDDQGNWTVTEGARFDASDMAAVEAAANHKTLGILRDLSLQAMVVLFVASLVVGWWLAGRALRPVRRITSTARDISATDLSRRIDLDGPRDELRELAETIDGMLGRLEAAFAAQRQLVDDASHELRNPLAVIQANVDAVLAMDDTTPAARATAAALVGRAVSRMTQLVEDLLSSARRGSPAFVDVEVDLAVIGIEAADEYALLAAERDLGLDRRLSPGPVVAGDPHALRRAVDNLLSNAVRLAPRGSEITVAVGSRDGWAWIAVRDQGPGIPAGDLEQIFDRFFTAARQVAESPADAGKRFGQAGLGLAIVRQIVESHDGLVAVHSTEDVGSTFVLWLPDHGATERGAERTARPPGDNPLPLSPVRTH
ncbi:cell wall metabolism sensor histidine kinase WalK [Kibdelosporangium persicum]|uniref:histidine kinase n=1 Tax=Kibdelosporangium persicum TaxID=2698649 RepID=A0ABX2F4F2_9PSEU|nr:HAMP domain-containing sensor histidine kinase [Kibdelosporangium persicum]NRN66218.1 Periplasmic sensor signal transduction histidine kinase [Kibdelosporangium persicum]